MDASQVVVTLGAMAAGSATIIQVAKVFRQTPEKPAEVKHDCVRATDLERDSIRINQHQRDIEGIQQNVREIYDLLRENKETYHGIDKAVAVILEKIK